MTEKLKDWKQVNIFASTILASGEKSCKIYFPKGSALEGYVAWLPVKLVRKNRTGKLATISFTSDFNFKAFKEEKGDDKKWKRIEGSEKELTADEFTKAFEAMDAKIKAYKAEHASNDDAPEAEVTAEDAPVSDVLPEGY